MNKLYFSDIFGTSFHFTNFGDTKFHTPLGLFLSVVLYALVASFIGVFGVDLFNRINPKIVSEQVRPLKHKEFLLDSSKFTLAWRIQDENGDSVNFTDKLWPIISYESYQRNNITGVMDYKKIELAQEGCTLDNVKDPNFLQGRILSMWQCINFDKYNLTVGGYWEADFVKYFSAWIYFCPNNNRKDPKCRTLEELKELLNQRGKWYFTIMYPEFYFEPGNLQNPLRYQYVEYFSTISVNLNKRERIYFKPVTAEDDQNLLLTEYKSHNLTVFRGFQNEVLIKFDDDIKNPNLGSDLYSFLIYFDKGGDKFTRTFMKLQDLAATVGGFMQLIFVVGKVLCHQYNSYQRNLSLINEIFEFTEAESKSNNIKDHKKRMVSFAGISDTEVYLKKNDSNDKTDILKLEENNINTKKKVSNRLLAIASNGKSALDTQFASTDVKPIKEDIDLLSELKEIDLKTENWEHSNKSSHNKEIEIKEKDQEKILFRSLNSKTSSTGDNKYNLTERQNLMELEAMKERKKTTTGLPSLMPHREDFISKKLEEEKNKIKATKKHFGLGLSLFLKKFLCHTFLKDDESQKVRIYDFASDYLKEKLDIYSYIKIVQNYEKLQMISLNEMQILAFKYTKKPNLNNNEECNLYDMDLTQKYHKSDDEIDNSMIKLVRYFVFKLQNNSFEHVDKYLWDFLDPMLKKTIIAVAKEEI